MEGKYPIMIDDALAGTLEVTKKGAMTVFDARCKGTDELLRLSVYGDDSEGYLGVMVPEGGEMRLRRSLSPLSMRGFPEEIVSAGPAGRGNAGQQGKAEKSAAPRSDSGKMTADREEKQETAPPERPREECSEPAPCEADCGEAVPPAPPETGCTPEAEKPEPPCEKCPERPEAEPPCEKRPERPEAEPPCEKPPKCQGAEPPCEKHPEQQEAKPPCEKHPEPAGVKPKQQAPTAPSAAEDAPENAENLCWYASPDGALVCFDGVHSLIALPPKDERVPQNIPGHPRQIEGRDYLVYVTKNGRIVS